MRHTRSLLVGIGCISSSILWASLVEADSASMFATKQRVPIVKQVTPLDAFKTSTIDKDDSRSQIVSSVASSVRGGSGDAPTLSELGGASVFIAIEIILRQILKAKSIKFPAQLAGCVALFVFLLAAQVISPGSGDTLCAALKPGSMFLTKWTGVFFVPGLAMLPLAPSIGSPFEIVKTLGVVVLGFFFSLAIAAYSAYGVRRIMGATYVEPPSTGGAGKAASAKPYRDETMSFLLKGTIVSAAISIAASKQGFEYKKPLETVFLTLATITSFVWGARLPPAVTTILNPLLSSAMVTLAIIRLTGMATGSSFLDILKSYASKSLHPLEAGGGDVLLFLLGPCVISFAVGIYNVKSMIASNLAVILTAVIVGSLGSLYGTAAFVRMINLGGPNGAVLRCACIPRSIQTALGMTIADILGGNVAIAATVIILTGIFGGMVGAKTLDAWGMKDPVCRGLGIGSSALTLGVASIKGEPEAFAFGSACLVLTAVAATSLASIPSVAKSLMDLAGGAAKIP